MVDIGYVPSQEEIDAGIAEEEARKNKEIQLQQPVLTDQERIEASTNPYDNLWSSQPVPTDAAGRPLAPLFNTIGDTDTGLLKQPYITQDQLNTQGLEAYRNEALRDPGTMSRWGQMALAQAQDQNAQMAASQAAQAQGRLAMQGGLRTGARERLAAGGAQNALLANQQALRGVQMQDEATRQTQLQNLPGMEMQAAQYKTGVQDANINRAIMELAQKRAMQQGQYTEAMKAWGSEKTAAATPSSDGGMCVLTTACVKHMGMDDDCWVLEAARHFRDTYMIQTPERAQMVIEYFKLGEEVEEKISAREDASKAWTHLFWHYVIPFALYLEDQTKDAEGAFALYDKLVEKSKKLAQGEPCK